MSSHYTTVSCAEWEQMQNSIKESDAYRVHHQTELIRLEALRATRQAEMERMRQENARAVDAAQTYLIRTYQSVSEQISEQFRSQLTNSDFNTQLTELREAAASLSARTSAASNTIDRLATEFNSAVSALLAGRSHDGELAKRTLDELDKLLEQLRGLNPGTRTLAALQTLETQRASAASSIEDGNPQAALIVTQGSILAASRALTNAIMEREKYNAEIVKVCADFSELQAKVDIYASKEGTISYGIGEDSYECEYDIDFWSHGLFGSLREQIADLGQMLQKASTGPTQPGLPREAALRLRTLQSQLEKCDLEARRDLAGTLALENTVQRLYSGLEERGWSIESSGHQDDDARKPYAMTCTDGAGNTVSIVGASGERPEMPSFFYEAFADNEGMANLVKESVAATLQTEGINIESDVERNDCGGAATPGIFVERISMEAAQSATRRRESVRLNVESAR